MQRLTANPHARRCAVGIVLALLLAGIVVQRRTILDSLELIGSLSLPTIAVVALLGVVERVSRAEVVRFLLPGVSLGRAELISDVGSAASKGVPLGGPLATFLRWQIARDRGVAAVAFVTMLIASGVATAFVSWALPLVATVLDVAGREVNVADIVIIAASSAVLIGSAVFWRVVLHSTRAHGWVTSRSSLVLRRISSAVPTVSSGHADVHVTELRASLYLHARRPMPLLTRTTICQITGAAVLWVALRGLGVGDELGATEFLRVFFVAQVLGSFAPTPGGVGVVEAGMTGALVAAGVDARTALAGVLVFRFVTYVLPIVIGTLLYVEWQRTRRRAVAGKAEQRDSEFADGLGRSLTSRDHGPSLDSTVSDLSRAAYQGIRHDRHDVGHDRSADGGRGGTRRRSGGRRSRALS